MGMTRIALSGILLFAATLLTLSCAPSMQVTNNWRNSTYTGPAYKKIMVVAMTKPDPDKVTREELAKVSQGMGIEAYLIVRILGVGTEIQSYQAHSPSPSASATGTDSMMSMQWFGPEPSISKLSQVATLESRLYDAKTAGIVWRSTVNAVNPSPSAGQISKFVSLELKALSEKELIPSSAR